MGNVEGTNGASKDGTSIDKPKNLEPVKSYQGYNEDGEVVATQTAQDASQTVIDPMEVWTQANKLVSTSDTEFGLIRQAYVDAQAEGQDAIYVEGVPVSTILTATIEALPSYPESIREYGNNVVESSVDVHNSKQKIFNQEARNKVENDADVVRVDEKQ